MPIQLSKDLNQKHYEMLSSCLTNIELVVMDLDGTVLEHNNIEPEIRIKQVCKSLYTKYKLPSIIATGRTLTGSKNIIESISRNTNVPIALYNGSVIIHNNTFNIIEQKYIYYEELKNIFECCSIFSNYKIYNYFYMDNMFGYEEKVLAWSDNDKPLMEFNKQKVIWIEKLEIKNFLIDNTYPSAVLIDTTMMDNISKEALKASLNEIKNISLTSSSMNYIEIRPYGSNKGNALKILLQLMGVKKENVLTIGDNDNDVEMLHYASIGVAVSSASQQAKNASDFITEGGAFTGTLQILNLLDEFKRLQKQEQLHVAR